VKGFSRPPAPSQDACYSAPVRNQKSAGSALTVIWSRDDPIQQSLRTAIAAAGWKPFND